MRYARERHALNSAASAAVLVISAMITPALLILGSGSLVAAALARLGRVVDRARVLLQTPAAEAARLAWSDEVLDRWLARHAQRAVAAERAVTLFFVAIGVFVLDGLGIAADSFSGGRLTWLPVGLTIFGMALMLAGVCLMGVESRLASLQSREEISDRARQRRP